jgi:murein DD-endopeptidase MepM/ murein hydrolase activator NlpD
MHQPHTGVDFDGRGGDKVYAIADGVVRLVVRDKVGWTLGVTHPRLKDTHVIYGHLGIVYVPQGVRVHRGEVLGILEAGLRWVPHLHLGMMSAGTPQDPELHQFECPPGSSGALLWPVECLCELDSKPRED